MCSSDLGWMYLSYQVEFTQEGGCGFSNLSSFAHGGEHERQLVSMLPFRARLWTSTPSGFRIGPRTPKSAPEENADVITPARTRTPVNHATHLQRLLGSIPVGNSKYRNAERPMMIGKIQETIHAIASPAGSELGSASRA